MKILDCTLRDGGYYNDWHFSRELVSNYLNAIAGSGIDIVEIGLRSQETNKFWGPYAYSTDEFINTLEIPSSIDLAVMINAKEYIVNNKASKAILDKSFLNKIDSKVSIVRIAAHYKEVPSLRDMAKYLMDKGYTVIVNLMQTGGRSKEEITEALTVLKDVPLEALYFADSMGNMNTTHVAEVISTFKETWIGHIGFHAHNNMGGALQNCHTCIENGVEYIDGTILGMGRGAGNVQTEYLLYEASKLDKKYKPEALFPIVLKDFTDLQRKYEWGPNLLYYLSAEYNIHPTYIQELLSSSNSSVKDTINTLENLKKESSSSYSREKLNLAFQYKHKCSEGNWNPEALMAGKDILIIGSGPSVKEHKGAIESYIRREKPLTICLNINKNIASELIDLYAASHPVKIFSDVEKYKNLKKPLMIPINSLSENLSTELKSVETLNYGLKIDKDRFVSKPNGCEVPTPLVFAYALAASTAGHANSINVVGMDGYGIEDARQKEMNQLVEIYKESEKHKMVTSLTNTTYQFEQSTVYAHKPN